jgi:hypothetical protein
MQYFNSRNYDKMPFILHQTHRYLLIVYNITDYDGDSLLWTNNINVPCKPPTHVFEGKVRQKKWGQYTSKYGIYSILNRFTCTVFVTQRNKNGFRLVFISFRCLFDYFFRHYQKLPSLVCVV